MAEREREQTREHILKSSVLEDITLIQKAFDLVYGVQTISVSEFEALIRREGEKVFDAPEGLNSHNISLSRVGRLDNRTDIRIKYIQDAVSGEHSYTTLFSYFNGKLDEVISSTRTSVPKVDILSAVLPNSEINTEIYLMLRENSPIAYEKRGSTLHRGTLE